MKSRAGFYRDELVYRNNDGSVNHALTAIISTESDREFEKMVMLLRVSRRLCGFKSKPLPEWCSRGLLDWLRRLGFRLCCYFVLLWNRTSFALVYSICLAARPFIWLFDATLSFELAATRRLYGIIDPDPTLLLFQRSLLALILVDLATAVLRVVYARQR